MKTKKILKLEGLLSLTGSIALFTWWFAMPLFLPVADAGDNFQNLILDPQWTAVNLIGITALRNRIFHRVPLWFLIVGAPLFGMGILYPLRTLGLVLFCAGTIWLSLGLRKE